MADIKELSGVFATTVGIMAMFVVWVLSRYLEGKPRAFAIIGFLGWLAYTGVLGYIGFLGSIRPPGPPFVIVPAVIFLASFIVRNQAVGRFAKRVPTALLIGAESFRAIVEWVLHGLYNLDKIPQVLTYEGANFDILIGLTAPVMAVLVATNLAGPKAIRAWSWLGIAMLGNVAVRAFLTFPGPLNLLPTSPPNIGIGIFPFTFLPGFLVPLALCLHVLTLRAVPQGAAQTYLQGEKNEKTELKPCGDYHRCL